MGLKLDVLCNDGSSLQTCLADVYGETGRIGLGGAELALHTMCEEWHKSGHRVRLYNNPSISNGSPYEQYPIEAFIPHEARDILIVFRSPNHRAIGATGKKIWWSCDQYTIGDFRFFASSVDRIVTISPTHAEYFRGVYGIQNTTIIDCPVRVQDYEESLEKISHRMIFCSVPDRGLAILADAYPRIKNAIPDTSLVITSDYRLWGSHGANNERFIQRFMGMDGVKFLGAIPRREMVREQLLAEVQAYPCLYQELFAIAVAECQVAGAYPVTSSYGALETTNMATQVSGNLLDGNWVPLFADKVIETLLNENLPTMRLENQKMAIERFSPQRILAEWQKVFDA